MNKLPLTNIEKFKRVKFSDGNFNTPFEFREYFYGQGIYLNLISHGNYRNNYDILEGIEIEWKGNPFNLDHTNDNYVILTKKRREDD